MTWHARGDYFATVMPEGANRSVMIHQLSKWRSQVPFSKSKGQVQCVLFHPIRPMLFVATQRHVRVYDLVKQELTKKLMSGAKWISSLAIHPGGDNVLTGTYDKKVQWYDLDLSTMPYQVTNNQNTSIKAQSSNLCPHRFCVIIPMLSEMFSFTEDILCLPRVVMTTTSQCPMAWSIMTCSRTPSLSQSRSCLVTPSMMTLE